MVVSEQGDTKRSIGIYGDTINVAARMEDAAKSHGVACVISESVKQALDRREDQLLPIGTEAIEGISAPVGIPEYRPSLGGDCTSDRASFDSRASARGSG